MFLGAVANNSGAILYASQELSHKTMIATNTSTKNESLIICIN